MEEVRPGSDSEPAGGCSPPPTSPKKIQAEKTYTTLNPVVLQRQIEANARALAGLPG